MSIQDVDARLAEAAGKYLTFMLQQGVYGIPILGVREIIAVQPITSLPRVPAAVRGVINLRGKIIPVVDLRTCLELEAAEHDRSTCIVVLDLEFDGQLTSNIGVIVNAVREVSDIAPDDLQPPPKVGDRTRSSYILGLAKPPHEEHVITLLDTHAILSALFAEAGVSLDMEAPAGAHA